MAAHGEAVGAGVHLITLAAPRFHYTVILHRMWCVEAVIPASHMLPVVLSPAEVAQLLDCVAAPTHRTITPPAVDN